jgi:hypothetical protein
MRKILPILAILVVLIGAAPLSAQLIGTWAGEGKGFCYPKPEVDIVIYPWQNWKGEVYYTDETDKPVFEGEWYDADGYHGTFFGKMYPTPIEEYYLFKGEWTWFDPASKTAKPVVGGKFEMKFHFLVGTCNGFWDTEWPSPVEQGTMWGKKAV